MAVPPGAGCASIERFLRTAMPGERQTMAAGVTRSGRMTLARGGARHDAAIQQVNDSFGGLPGAALRDYWGYNVAAYRLAQMLGFNMVPPTVARRVDGRMAALSWWVDDAITEEQRAARALAPPDPVDHERQMIAARQFRQLVRDLDPNPGNLLLTPDGRIWLIDFTRAFGAAPELLFPGDFARCERSLLARLRDLDRRQLRRKLQPFLSDAEFEALLLRRDRITRACEAEMARRGAAAVLFDLERLSEPCGTGLRPLRPVRTRGSMAGQGL